MVTSEVLQYVQIALALLIAYLVHQNGVAQQQMLKTGHNEIKSDIKAILLKIPPDFLTLKLKKPKCHAAFPTGC